MVVNRKVHGPEPGDLRNFDAFSDRPATIRGGRCVQAAE